MRLNSGVSGVALSIIVATSQPATAGPIIAAVGVENAFAYAALIQHGAILGAAGHVIAFPFVNWALIVTIGEVDGGALGRDQVTVDVDSQHLVGPHGPPEFGNPAGVLYGLGTPGVGPPFAPGVNAVVGGAGPIHHPPHAAHENVFTATLTYHVNLNGLDIDAYDVYLVGTHCSSPCPVPPSIPEPTTLALTAPAVAIACFLCHRRMRRSGRVA